MKNLIPSFLIFIVLVIVMMFSTKYLNNKCIYYNSTIDSLETTVTNNLWDESYENCMNFLNEWNSDSHLISTFLHHLYVDDINSSLLELTQYVKYKDKTESLVIIHQIKCLLHELSHMEKITLYNIL